MSPDGLQASIEKMRAEGVGDAAIATFAHYYEQLREGASGMLPESDIEPVEDLPTLDDLPEGDPAIVDTAVVLKLNGGLGTSMGMTKAKSLIEAKAGRDLPRHRRRPGARPARALRRARAARAHELVRHARGLARGAAPPPARSSPTCRWTSCRTRSRRSTPTTCSRSTWERDPALEWAPPGHGDLYTALVTSGMLDTPARARLPLRLRLELRQPRRRPRSAHPVLGGARGAAVRDGGRRAHRGRPQGRAHRAPARRRPRAARDGADARGGPRLAAGRRPPPLRQHEQPVGRAGGAARHAAGARRRARAADHRQPQDGRPVGLRLPRRRPARDGDGRRDRRVRGRPRAARPAAALRAGQDDATTCSPCARTPTCCTRTTASSSRPSATSRRSSTSTPTTTSSSATSSRASRRGRRRWWRCERLTVSGDVTFGRDVVVRGAVTVKGPARIEDGTILTE